MPVSPLPTATPDRLTPQPADVQPREETGGDQTVDQKLDEDLKETFPASDATSQTDPTHGQKLKPIDE